MLPVKSPRVLGRGVASKRRHQFRTPQVSDAPGCPTTTRIPLKGLIIVWGEAGAVGVIHRVPGHLFLDTALVGSTFHDRRMSAFDRSSERLEALLALTLGRTEEVRAIV